MTQSTPFVQPFQRPGNPQSKMEAFFWWAVRGQISLLVVLTFACMISVCLVCLYYVHVYFCGRRKVYIDIFCVCSNYCRVVPTSWLFALEKGSKVQERQDHERRPSHQSDIHMCVISHYVHSSNPTTRQWTINGISHAPIAKT